MLRSRDRDLECTHVHANTKIQLDQVRIMGNLNVELTAELTATFLWQKGTYRILARKRCRSPTGGGA